MGMGLQHMIGFIIPTTLLCAIKCEKLHFYARKNVLNHGVAFMAI